MITQKEAIIEAFRALGGVRTAEEIQRWVDATYGPRWKDFGTSLADMVAPEHGGNPSSNVPPYFRILKRESRGKYRLVHEI